MQVELGHDFTIQRGPGFKDLPRFHWDPGINSDLDGNFRFSTKQFLLNWQKKEKKEENKKKRKIRKNKNIFCLHLHEFD